MKKEAVAVVEQLPRQAEQERGPFQAPEGLLGIQEIAATVSNTPMTISRTDVTIRLKHRK